MIVCLADRHQTAAEAAALYAFVVGRHGYAIPVAHLLSENHVLSECHFMTFQGLRA